MNLNVFIDESGIHKKIGHSSFVVVYISILDQEKFDKEIIRIENNLKINYFHWADYGSKSGWKIRSEFIIKVLSLPFSFKYVIVANPVNLTIELYNSITTMLTEKNIQNIYIDGKYSRKHEQKISKLLRDKGLSVKNLKTVTNRSVPAIRLADALAGLIRSYYDNPSLERKNLFQKITQHKKRDPPF